MGPQTVLLAALLGFATITDLKTRTIPNALTLTGVAAGLALTPANLPAALAAALLLGGLSLARPDGFGMGDAKLVTAIAALAGGTTAVLALTLGCLLALGSAATMRRSTVPLAPFLLGGTALSAVWTL